MSPYMQQAIVAAEDTRFYQHNGVDVKGVARAFVANQQAGGVSQGASTLTMQYVRMALRDGATTPAGGASRRPSRPPPASCARCGWRSSWRSEITKQEILERYLNIGVLRPPRVRHLRRRPGLLLQDARRTSRSPRPPLLAGLVKAPTAYDPAGGDQTAGHRPAQLRASTDGQDGLRSPPTQAADGQEAEPIQLKLTDPPNDCVSVARQHNDWGFFCDYFKNWWLRAAGVRRDPGEREENLRRGGYRIVTTLDPKIQDVAVKHVRAKESAQQHVRPRSRC